MTDHSPSLLPNAPCFRLRTLVLSFALFLLAALPLSAEQFGHFFYSVTDSNTVTIVNYNYTTGEVVIPAEIAGLPVTTIGSVAFWGRSGLTSVTIPDSVTSIGSSAFVGCSGLTSVTIPDSVTSIGSEAFRACSGLTSVIIPDSVTSMGNGAFSSCSGLTSVTISAGLSSIEADVFGGCTGLTSVLASASHPDFKSRGGILFNGEELVKFPTGRVGAYQISPEVTTIGVGAFYGCHGLTSVTLPDSVIEIGASAFERCGGLAIVTIPDSVTLLGDSVFERCIGLTSVAIPESVTLIGDSGFKGCEGLTSVTIPESMTLIGDSAFEGCDGLTSVTIPDAVLSIGDRAFYGCNGLSSVTILDAITPIGDSAFEQCSRLTSLRIGNSITSIGAAAFESCHGLTSVTIPDSVTSISEAAFKDCRNLTSVIIGESVTTISAWAFRDCIGLKSLVIPDSVATIGNSAFAGCSDLTSVTIGNSVTGIGVTAFEGCRGLTSVAIPNSVTSIGALAFSECSLLTSVRVGKSVTSVGFIFSAFERCRSLTSIEVDSENVVFSSLDGVLLSHDKSKLIKYPEGKEGAYLLPDSIVALELGAFYYCQQLTWIDVAPGHSHFSSVGGVLFDTDQTTLIQYPTGRSGAYSVPENVHTLASSAFDFSLRLTLVTLPESLNSIEGGGFFCCPNLSLLFLLGNAPSTGGTLFMNRKGNVDAPTVFYLSENSAPHLNGVRTVMLDNASDFEVPSWLLAQELPYDTDLSQDLNGDGVSLLTAYALDLDPSINLASSMPRPEVREGKLDLSFQGVTPGITYSVETSTDLQTWTTDGVTLSDPNEDGMKTATIERNGPSAFMRLVVHRD